MTRIEKTFKELKSQGKKAFIAFITAGYPDLAATEKLVLEFDRIGVDIVELGVPFSDPMADGPIIQEASSAALKKNVNIDKIFNLAGRIRQKTAIPLCLMTYYNPVFCYGESRFINNAKKAGIDGIIIPDLPPEESAQLRKLAKKNGIDVICFIAPTTAKERIGFIVRCAGGFIYYISLTGVTGARKGQLFNAASGVRKIKRITQKPVCVGFGISTPGQVREISACADGVIVGSAIVKKIKESGGSVSKVSRFVRTLMRPLQS